VTGPLDGVRVVEVASFWGAWAGKLLGDLGADVVLVEPPGGHATRTFGPFVADEPHPDRSLWWWYYNTSKRSVVIDLDTPRGCDDFRRLVGAADIVVEGEVPGRLAALGLDHVDLRAGHPELIWVSVTSHGRESVRSREPWTDLTVSAASGIAWLNGYDDHTLPPMRGRGTQTLQITGTFAAMATLTALLHRDAGGTGQHVDVSAFAACNVTADGRHVTTGFLPQSAADFQVILEWLDDLGLRDTSPEVFFLDIGVSRGGVDVATEMQDPEALAVLEAARAALVHIAENIPALDFFEGAQRRDLQVGIVLAPEEAFENQHFVARGMQVAVRHDELDRNVRYPGAPFVMPRSPWAIRRRPPLIGEHQAEVLGHEP
jgi:crotonobetainyl-CoA:carnitine CoA-transferase CaiB-like acyl-CoA transferase